MRRNGPPVPSYPASTKYFGEVAGGYLERREAHPTWEWENEQVSDYIQSLGGARMVLDVPLGTGRFVPLYHAANWQVQGCDISPDMLAEAERRLSAEAYSRCHVMVSPS